MTKNAKTYSPLSTARKIVKSRMDGQNGRCWDSEEFPRTEDEVDEWEGWISHPLFLRRSVIAIATVSIQLEIGERNGWTITNCRERNNRIEVIGVSQDLSISRIVTFIPDSDIVDGPVKGWST